MKKLLITLALLAGIHSYAQELYNNGAVLSISNGATMRVNGKMTHTNGGVLTNNGSFSLTGDFKNDEAMSAYNNGSLLFVGTAAQRVDGSSGIWTKNVTINNAAGVTFDQILKIDGACTFTNGIAQPGTVNTPLLFTSNGSHSGASDASHVSGYVIKEGTGSFSYPVGDGTRFQKADVSLTANSSGLRVKYNPGNAGYAPLTGSLLYYNNYEYWDISPLGSASGTVTIYWDTYNNKGIGGTGDLRVAHKTGGSWLNEGANNLTGTIASGSVTSNTVNSWSPFTLGSVTSNSTLPLHWLSVTARMNKSGQAEIRWQVSEQNVRTYLVERSFDKQNFAAVANISSKGNGDNSYEYIDQLKQDAYYRIRQIDRDEAFTHSPIVKVPGEVPVSVNVFPCPFQTSFTIFSPVAQVAQLFAYDGRLVKVLLLSPGNNYVDASRLARGLYSLQFNHGQALQLIKR